MFSGLLLLIVSAAALPPCVYEVDGDEVTALDCERGGAWTVRCPLPEARSGKARVSLSMPDRSIEAEAPLSMQAGSEKVVELAIGGPGNRTGPFVVEEAVMGLLPGQAVGPLQLCPVVQPGVAPGSPRGRLPLEVRVTRHVRDGFDEQVDASGVATRVPRFGPGEVFASGRIEVVQRPVRSVPVLTGSDALPVDEGLDGQLQVRGPDGAWHSVGFKGRRQEIGGPIIVTRFDFVAAEVAAGLGGDPAQTLEADLAAWLRGEETLLSRAAWARSDAPSSGAATFRTVQQGGTSWRVARTDDGALELRVARLGERVRVVIGWGALGVTDSLVEVSTADLD